MNLFLTKQIEAEESYETLKGTGTFEHQLSCAIQTYSCLGNAAVMLTFVGSEEEDKLMNAHFNNVLNVLEACYKKKRN